MTGRKVLTTCVYCGCGCQYYLDVRDNRIIGVSPSRNHPVAQGALCVKGWNGAEFVHHPDRLTHPLIREGSSFRTASWEEALSLIVTKLGALKKNHGGGALAFFGSAKCTNEENYLLMKLARAVYGTNSVDHCARLCHASTVAGLARSFGSGAMTNSVADFDEADLYLVTGSNTTEQHPLIGSRIIRGVRERGAALILVDPRKIPLSRFARHHFMQPCGSDVVWLNGLMNVIIDEGLENRDFIENHTEGYDELTRAVREYTPSFVESLTGIPADDLRPAARLFARAHRAMIVYSMGITQHTHGVDNVRSCANLALLTGQIGRPGTGVNPLRGQNNVQGACDAGVLPDVYCGYQKVSDEKSRLRFQQAWKVAELPAEDGLTTTMVPDAILDGTVKGLFIMGENPLISDPYLGHVEKAFGSIDFLVVQDIFLTETAQVAHVVLPGAAFAEKEGTFTSTERRVQRVHKAVEPPGESREDWRILAEIFKRAGGDGLHDSPGGIFAEMAALSPIYGGMTYRRLEEGWGLQWPCPSPDHPGTPYLHRDGNFTRGKGAFAAVHHEKPDETVDDDYPLTLTTGRTYFHWHTRSMTGRTSTLEREVPESYVEIHRADALHYGVRHDHMITISSRRGSIAVRAQVSDMVRKGTVFIPFHFAAGAANRLTNNALDPVARIPEYKVCAVRIEKERS